MDQLWVALLAVGTVLFSSNVSGSVWHGLASGVPGYPQLVPYELAYTVGHSPVALSQIHGLHIDEALANARNENEQGQSPSNPIVETPPVEDTGKFITQEQLYQQLFGANPESSEGTNAIEDGGAPTTGLETPSSSVQSEVPASPTVADTSVPQSVSEISSVQDPVSPLPTPGAPQQEGQLQSQGISTNNVGGVYIKAEEGSIQMQAALQSGGNSVNVSVGDIPKLDDDSAPIIVSEFPPASSSTKSSKLHSQTNVNLNVNVNVNGDGKGSVINSTSVAEITAPITKTGHKKCD